MEKIRIWCIGYEYRLESGLDIVDDSENAISNYIKEQTRLIIKQVIRDKKINDII